MQSPPARPRDPIGWTIALTAIFVVLASIRLTIPSAPFFDEVHYVPAARTLLAMSKAVNTEHPPLSKQVLALGMWLLGDRPLGWRIMPLAFGTLALFAAMRAMWFASCSRAASLLTGFYLATGFQLIVNARIAMLDMIMLGFVMAGLWMVAGAVREPETARRRLIVAGAAMGAAMACKWNAAPVAALPGLAFLVIRARATGWRFATSRRGAPVPGITLAEAFVWLGALPAAVYAASYWPFEFYAQPYPYFAGRGYFGGLISLHQHMLELQTQLKTPHPYQSTWVDWVIDRRVIWFLYEKADGAQRGVMLVGNPLTMLAGLPALAWCAWAGLVRRRVDAGAVALLYAASLGMWVVAPKPVQFYYHYLLPSCFLLAALALATEALWLGGDSSGGRWRRWNPWSRRLAALLVLGALGLFAFFYPILTAGSLNGPRAFLTYAWIPSWR